LGIFGKDNGKARDLISGVTRRVISTKAGGRLAGERNVKAKERRRRRPWWWWWLKKGRGMPEGSTKGGLS